MKANERRMVESVRTYQPFEEGPVKVLAKGLRYVVAVRKETIAFGEPGRMTIRSVELNPVMVSRINALLSLAIDDAYKIVRNPADNDWLLAIGERRVRIWYGDITIKTDF